MRHALSKQKAFLIKYITCLTPIVWITLEKVAEMRGKKYKLVNLVWRLGKDQTSPDRLFQIHFPDALMLT